MALRVYWEWCKKYVLTCADVWYKGVPDEVKVSENGMVGIWWDRSVVTTQKMEHNRPDLQCWSRWLESGLLVISWYSGIRMS